MFFLDCTRINRIVDFRNSLAYICSFQKLLGSLLHTYEGQKTADGFRMTRQHHSNDNVIRTNTKVQWREREREREREQYVRVSVFTK